ncbi:MAG: right-handed parallel beta-helix repeat-containing protein [Gammaproteobacteria bacterium]
MHMLFRRRLVGWILVLGSLSQASQAAVLEIGPGKKYAKPSEAANAAGDGDIIEIMAGTYMYDVANWAQNDLTIRGVGGRAHLQADGAAADEKAIWVIKGDNVIIESIEFSGARVRDKNGAGIRQEGTNLTVRDCYFHHNEMGILTNPNEQSSILIEHSEFANNAVGDDSDEYGHNIYIGRVGKFELKFSYVHDGRIGNNVKSRALESHILYNRIMDEKKGSSSYLIDIPDAGTAYIIGNLLQQGVNTDNSTLVAFGAESRDNPSHGLYIVNNTFVNDHAGGIYVKNWSQDTKAFVVNNVFASVGDTILDGRGDLVSNLVTDAPGFIDRARYDYHLKASSPAFNAGADPGSANGVFLVPKWQYRHPAGREERAKLGKLDLGAYEYEGVR